jgi:hypothetical protein
MTQAGMACSLVRPPVKWSQPRTAEHSLKRCHATRAGESDELKPAGADANGQGRRPVAAHGEYVAVSRLVSGTNSRPVHCHFSA